MASSKRTCWFPLHTSLSPHICFSSCSSYFPLTKQSSLSTMIIMVLTSNPQEHSKKKKENPQLCRKKGESESQNLCESMQVFLFLSSNVPPKKHFSLPFFFLLLLLPSAHKRSVIPALFFFFFFFLARTNSHCTCCFYNERTEIGVFSTSFMREVNQCFSS